MPRYFFIYYKISFPMAQGLLKYMTRIFWENRPLNDIIFFLIIDKSVFLYESIIICSLHIVLLQAFLISYISDCLLIPFLLKQSHTKKDYTKNQFIYLKDKLYVLYMIPSLNYTSLYPHTISLFVFANIKYGHPYNTLGENNIGAPKVQIVIFSNIMIASLDFSLQLSLLNFFDRDNCRSFSL